MSVLARGERTYDEFDLARGDRAGDGSDLARGDRTSNGFDLARGDRTYEEFDLALETGLDSLGDDETPRESKRTPVVRMVEYSPYPRSDASEHLATGFTANESRGGLCMLTREAHAVGAPLRIAVRDLDGRARLEAIARVAWCNPEAGDRVAVGLEFLEVRNRQAQSQTTGPMLTLAAQPRTTGPKLTLAAQVRTES